MESSQQQPWSSCNCHDQGLVEEGLFALYIYLYSCFCCHEDIYIYSQLGEIVLSEHPLTRSKDLHVNKNTTCNFVYLKQNNNKNIKKKKNTNFLCGFFTLLGFFKRSWKWGKKQRKLDWFCESNSVLYQTSHCISSREENFPIQIMKGVLEIWHIASLI